METMLKICSIHSMDPDARPATRAKAHGCSALTDDELLTIILGSKELCKYAHRELAEMSISQMTANGIGAISAIKISALKEYCQRMMSMPSNEKLSSVENSVSYLRPKMQNLNQEQFRLLCLNGAMRLIDDQVLTIGTINASLVSVRETLMSAIRSKAENIIIAHNHPDGDSTPSQDDLNVTEQMKLGCQAVGIRLCDHIIIGRNGNYYSIREHGYLN